MFNLKEKNDKTKELESEIKKRKKKRKIEKEKKKEENPKKSEIPFPRHVVPTERDQRGITGVRMTSEKEYEIGDMIS